MAYSSIIRKNCKCGCNRPPTIGYAGYNQNCNPEKKKEILAKLKSRQSEQLMNGKTNNQRKQIKSSVKAQVRTLLTSETNKDTMTKARLLKLADAAFSRFIRNRDTKKGR